jgi:hypothetical protein
MDVSIIEMDVFTEHAPPFTLVSACLVFLMT